MVKILGKISRVKIFGEIFSVKILAWKFLGKLRKTCKWQIVMKKYYCKSAKNPL